MLKWQIADGGALSYDLSVESCTLLSVYRSLHLAVHCQVTLQLTPAMRHPDSAQASAAAVTKIRLDT